MKFNGRLLLFFVLVVAILVATAALTFEVSKDTRTTQSALDNLEKGSFVRIDTCVFQDDELVYGEVDGVIYNPLDLDVTANDDAFALNWKTSNLDGKYVKTDYGYRFEGVIRDSYLALGKEGLDVKVTIDVNADYNAVKKIVLSYTDNGFLVIITALRNNIQLEAK
ncbi:MAG: hypothetical protein ACI4MY_04670 [Christensenellales bacterium]